MAAQTASPARLGANFIRDDRRGDELHAPETGLRTDDRFDVAKALAAIEAFRAWKHWWLQAKSERVH